MGVWGDMRWTEGGAGRVLGSLPPPSSDCRWRFSWDFRGRAVARTLLTVGVDVGGALLCASLLQSPWQVLGREWESSPLSSLCRMLRKELRAQGLRLWAGSWGSGSL